MTSGGPFGFDLPDDRSAGSAGGTASPVGRVLAGLPAEIGRRKAAARHLLAIRFDVGAVRVALRERPPAADYPSLATVFGPIARTCTCTASGPASCAASCSTRTRSSSC